MSSPVSFSARLACISRSPTGQARGATVPLTGFGNALAQGVKKAVAEKGFLGVFTGGFTAAAAGICAAVFFGFLVAVIFKSRDKSK